MEKCKGCKWNFEGMVCPEHTFCGKSMEQHDNRIIKETKAKVYEEVLTLLKNLDNNSLSKEGLLEQVKGMATI